MTGTERGNGLGTLGGLFEPAHAASAFPLFHYSLAGTLDHPGSDGESLGFMVQTV